jgi:hypothetical protein
MDRLLIALALLRPSAGGAGAACPMAGAIIDRARPCRARRKRRSPASAVTALVISALAVGPAFTSGARSQGIVGGEVAVEILAEIPLDDALARANDIRWLNDNRAALSVGTEGTFSIGLRPDHEVARLLPAGIPWLAKRLAVSDGEVLVAASLRELVRVRHGSAAEGFLEFESIEDIDARGGRVAVLGTRFGPDRTPSPDGALAWTATIAELPWRSRDPRAPVGNSPPPRGARSRALAFPFTSVSYSRQGPGSNGMSNCSLFAIGAVRFMPSGELFVLPGAEPGAFLYAADGTLVRAWPGNPLGVVVPCLDMEEELEYQLSGSERQRLRWLNQRTIADDVLPADQGPVVVVRRVGPHGPRWHAVALSRETGETRTFELPFSGSPVSRLHADVRAGRALFLRYEAGHPADATEPPGIWITTTPWDAEIAP